jgi:hypothetical protein
VSLAQQFNEALLRRFSVDNEASPRLQSMQSELLFPLRDEREVGMEVHQKDLAQMSRRERNRVIGEMAKAATAHREEESRIMHVLHAIRGFFSPGRVPR